MKQTNTVIAIVNEKGGTGKTTTAVSLSAALGELGQKVLLVDLDGQAAASRWVGVEEDHRLAESLCTGKSLEPIRDVLLNVSLAPASGKLDSVSHELRPTQGGQLRKVLSELTGYDFMLIDCPPSLGNRLIGNALLAATHVIVPVETSILALDGLKILLTTLEDVREGFGHDIVLAGVLAVRYDVRTKLSQLVLEELRRALPGRVFDTVIRENVRIRECPASGQSIMHFAPDSHAACDYQALAQEMLKDPDKWRRPAVQETHLAGDGKSAGRLSVDGLRDSAAARVRESAAARKPAEPSADASAVQPVRPAPLEAEPQTQTPAPVEEQSGQKAPQQPEPQPVPDISFMLNWPEANAPQGAATAQTDAAPPLRSEPTPAAASTPASGTDGDFKTWLEGLDQAEERIECRQEIDGTSKTPGVPSSGDSLSPAPQCGSELERKPGPAEAPAAPASMPHPASQTIPAPVAETKEQTPQPSPQVDRPSAGGAEDYPALRSLLRQMDGKKPVQPEQPEGEEQDEDFAEHGDRRPAWRRLLVRNASRT